MPPPSCPGACPRVWDIVFSEGALFWWQEQGQGSTEDFELSLARSRKIESESLEMRATIVESAQDNARQLETLRKELMQTRNTIAKYQTAEDAAERKRLLDEAEARRRAMLAGVGYADLVQCRAFLNEFNSDEMLVRWASLRWSIIARCVLLAGLGLIH